MFGKNQVSDRDLLKQINQRLARTGTASQSKVNVSVQQGNVTLTGTLQHAGQRSPIVKAVSRVTGIRRVVDQMTHTVKKAPRPPAGEVRSRSSTSPRGASSSC
jgi:osmotically-inducible protein OsmY